MWNVSHVFKMHETENIAPITQTVITTVNKSLLKYNAITCKYICVVSMNAFIQIKRSLYELSQILCKKTKHYNKFCTVSDCFIIDKWKGL